MYTDMDYALDAVKEALKKYENSRELSLAKTKLEEFEMWLDRSSLTR